MVVNYGSWLMKPYLGKNQNNPSSPMTTIPQTRSHLMEVKEDERVASCKSFWIRLIGIYFMLLTVTICIIGTILYLFVLPKSPVNACNYSTKGIYARIEELERKLHLFERSFPADIKYEVKVYWQVSKHTLIYI